MGRSGERVGVVTQLRRPRLTKITYIAIYVLHAKTIKKLYNLMVMVLLAATF